MNICKNETAPKNILFYIFIYIMVRLVVYGDKNTPCTQTVLILLEELQLKYDLQSVSLKEGENKEETFLKLNPFGKVPVVEYDEYVIFESRSILRFISKNNTDIVDLTLNDSVNVDMWLEVESNNFNPPVGKIIYERLFNESPSESVIRDSMNSLKKVLEVYEERLSNHKYIGGEEFSIADIPHISYVNSLLKCGSEYKRFLKNYPNMYKWLKRVFNRESVKIVMN